MGKSRKLLNLLSLLMLVSVNVITPITYANVEPTLVDDESLQTSDLNEMVENQPETVEKQPESTDENLQPEVTPSGEETQSGTDDEKTQQDENLNIDDENSDTDDDNMNNKSPEFLDDDAEPTESFTENTEASVLMKNNDNIETFGNSEVTITYNLSGGYRVEDGSTETKEGNFVTDANGMVSTTNRKTPSKSGNTCDGMKCMFDGWYLEPDGITRWTGYADRDMTVYAKWLPFEDKDVTLGDITITIMDRNLGATASGTGCSNSDTSTCGYHFQWGNNYGFKPYQNSNTTFPNGEKPISAKATDREGHTSTYYNGIWRYNVNPWNDGAQNDDNLRGGSETSNSDADRQGPCPDGYHVPDTLEWKAVGTLLNAGTNGYTVRDTLNLPFAGYRYYANNYVYGMGSHASYWSSTPSDSNYAYCLYFDSSYIYRQNDYSRSYAYSVRCFKNSSPQTLTFSAGDEVLTTKDIRWWEPVTKSYAPDAPERENAEFVGWFADGSDEAFVFGTDVYLSQDTTLNAKFECKAGYVENDEKTACEKIGVEFDANGGSFDDGENANKIEALINTIAEKETKVSHTVNLQDDGEYITDTTGIPGIYMNGNTPLYYNASQNVTDVLSFSETSNLQVNIKYGGALGSNCVGIAMWTGNHSDYTVANNSTSAFMLQPQSNFPMSSYFESEYRIDSDAVTVSIYNVCPSFGYYLAVTKPAEYEVYYADGAFDNISEPTREGHSFKGWYLADGSGFNTGNVSTGEIIKVHAEWECAQGYVDKQGECVKEEKKSGGSSGGGGRSSKDVISNVDSASGDSEKSTEQKDSDTGMDSSANASEGQANSQEFSTYSQEFINAYEFAYKNGITTIDSIEKVNLNGKLTRIQMAKMLSQYAINVLGKTPDTSRTIKFKDVSNKLDGQYNNGVTLAYQLGIMGINMPKNKFRPNDEVTRAEFATALSRMLYSTPDGKPYYTTHLEKLKAEGILTNDDPKMKERRGYVMLMLMRSAK